MKVNDYLRAIAGSVTLVSVALGTWAHPGFYFLTAFVGLNLLQSAFTGWCPMISILRRVGVEE